VSILHDMLYIGAAVRLQTNNTVTPQQMQQPAYAVSPQPTLTAQDQQMVLMLAQQGGVDPATATSLLFEAQGDMNLALQRIGMMKQQMGM
jgi:hypothetical protein